MRGTVNVTAESADPDGGSVIDSLPADEASGTTTSSASVARPVLAIRTRGGFPSTSAVRCPSSRASRTSSPGGTWMLTHPCFNTSIVRRTSPLTVSPVTRSA